MQYALVKNGLVEKVILADAEFIDSLEPDWDVAVPVDVAVSIGWSYADGIFAPPAPVEENPITPQPARVRSLPMASARRALLNAGLLSRVDSAINMMPSPDKEHAKIDWEYRTTVERNSSLVRDLGKALDLTEAQIDDLFKAGASL